MAKQRGMTKEEFDELLAWLDPDRERAGLRYEEIRRSLIRIFTWRECPDAEDLADETFNRTAEKVSTIRESYTGDPAAYIYGVANRVAKENRRLNRLHEEFQEAGVQPARATEELEEEEAESERVSECLKRCLQELSDEQRSVFLRYHLEESGAKIGNRKNLAAQLRIAQNTLRVRVHRTRAALEECIERCLGHAPGGETD